MGECSRESPTPTTPPDESSKLNEKQRHAKKNRRKQRLNHKAKNKIHKSFTTHKEMLQDLGQLGNNVSLDNASYSMMHSLEEGLSIVLYIGTRTTHLMLIGIVR